jgi:hypothetical protein
MHALSAFCPNCSSPLASAAVPACENCEANFTRADGWKPVGRPVGKYVPRFKQPPKIVPKATREPNPDAVSSGERIVRAVIAFPLFLSASILLLLAVFTLGKLDFLVPGVLFAAASYGIMTSRKRVPVIMSIVGAGLLYLMLVGAFNLLGGAIYSR